MHWLYSIAVPTEAAVKPVHWSYSLLAEWRICPRRWWLLQSRYNGRSYPTPLTIAALRGSLVHRPLEAYSLHLQRSRETRFDVRSFLRTDLDASLSAQANDNPRVNVSVLRARFSLDEAVAFFWRVAEHFAPSAAHAPDATAVSRLLGSHKHMSGPEVWIDADDPPCAVALIWFRTVDYFIESLVVSFEVVVEQRSASDLSRSRPLL
jgi:hypothetical protein